MCRPEKRESRMYPVVSPGAVRVVLQPLSPEEHKIQATPGQAVLERRSRGCCHVILPRCGPTVRDFYSLPTVNLNLEKMVYVIYVFIHPNMQNARYRDRTGDLRITHRSEMFIHTYETGALTS
jgi:hypothetical protein